ncbi:hypothetical protein SJI19_08510 [Acerihabitans sp. TG2]|uniref:hypothetical protein n=1 Tax=Acerihabitans sp. TG2 TaxID=3096008 RepID=UPI002B2298B8|nr:hypothetical protein [Acerihabitans sp. TG2]MEA9390582.1 hypothetical protein [Acerihabitans sp. TG2]
MKHICLTLFVLIVSATAYASPPYRLPDMPHDPRLDSACLNKTTATTASKCPRQIFSPGKNQATDGYSPVYHKR